ncbi:MAG: preprotein translocase subunit YajC [Azovibrio sp.]|uniref:preprotein translocase subunit YajC n=1 Tax=Azovibrio sp. TaxID=1872673 RepID=UPI003C729F37
MISLAHAQEAVAAAGPAGGLMQFLPLILMFVVIWFLMIRPQMKRAKEHKAMTDALQKGDEVVTQGGITGRIVKVGDHYIALEVAEGVEIVVQRPAVQIVLPKGTLKSAV